MKKAIIPTLAVLALFGVLVGLAAFTDLNSPQYYGKTGDKVRAEAIDANFTALEDGTEAINGAAITNLAGGNIASGNIAVARIATALTAPGTIGSVTPAAGAFTTLASSGEASMAGGQAILKDGSLASAQTATNNAPILLAGTIVQLDATGGINLATNTITLTSLGTGTNGVFYVINTGTSNLLAIAQTGTWKSPAVELGTNEAMTVIGIAGSFYGIE